MKENIIKDKSFGFAVRIVKLYQYLCEEKKEYVLSKQLLRSGQVLEQWFVKPSTQSQKSDFKHKMAIAQKEINESIYWL